MFEPVQTRSTQSGHSRFLGNSSGISGIGRYPYLPHRGHGDDFVAIHERGDVLVLVGRKLDNIAIGYLVHLRSDRRRVEADSNGVSEVLAERHDAAGADPD